MVDLFFVISDRAGVFSSVIRIRLYGNLQCPTGWGIFQRHSNTALRQFAMSDGLGYFPASFEYDFTAICNVRRAGVFSSVIRIRLYGNLQCPTGWGIFQRHSNTTLRQFAMSDGLGYFPASFEYDFTAICNVRRAGVFSSVIRIRLYGNLQCPTGWGIFQRNSNTTLRQFAMSDGLGYFPASFEYDFTAICNVRRAGVFSSVIRIRLYGNLQCPTGWGIFQRHSNTTLRQFAMSDGLGYFPASFEYDFTAICNVRRAGVFSSVIRIRLYGNLQCPTGWGIFQRHSNTTLRQFAMSDGLGYFPASFEYDFTAICNVRRAGVFCSGISIY